jgi:hypothetical protein
MRERAKAGFQPLLQDGLLDPLDLAVELLEPVAQ